MRQPPALAAAPDGASRPAAERWRPWLRATLLLTGLVVAVRLLAPQAEEVPASLTAILDAHPGWLVVAVGLAFLPYLAAALALQGAVPQRLPYRHLTQIQVAGAFATVIAPAGLATLALTARYLDRAGVPRAQAVAAVATARIATTAGHLLLLILLAPIALDHVTLNAPPPHWLLPATATATGIATILRRSPTARARTATLNAWIGDPLRQVAPNGPRAGLLAGGSMAISATRAMTLYACLLTLGAQAPLLVVIALFLTAEAAGMLTTSPAGLGVMDGIAITGLATLGVATATAIAAILLFRLLTFWTPIIPGALTLWRLHHHRLV